jgi:hypothetical protein
MWWLLVILVVLVFYLLLPGIGFVVVRQNWRRFRRMLIDSTAFPYLDYSDLQKPMEQVEGPFRFLGKLQAFEESGNIWLSSAKLSVKIDLSQTRVFTLPSEDAMASDDPESLDAARISILPSKANSLFLATWWKKRVHANSKALRTAPFWFCSTTVIPGLF